MRYCRTVNQNFLKQVNQKKPTTMAQLADIWYGSQGCEYSRTHHYNDSRYAQLKEYLSGQYSDGWGEGFEQREVFSYTETETSEEYDEEADEYYESEWDVRYDVYISFWQDKNFRLMTEAELKG